MKYSNIAVDSDDELECIIGTALKFERARNWDKTTAVKRVYIPISNELKELLERSDYKSNLDL